MRQPFDSRTLCSDCQDEVDLEVPQFHGQPVFNGSFTPQTCDRCDTPIRP